MALVCVVGMVGSSSLTDQTSPQVENKGGTSHWFHLTFRVPHGFHTGRGAQSCHGRHRQLAETDLRKSLRWDNVMHVQDVQLLSKPHFRVLKMFIMSDSCRVCEHERWRGSMGPVGTVAHRQEAQAVPDWETGGTGFTQRAVGGHPPPAPAHSMLMSLTHPGTRSTVWCSNHGKK